MFSATKLRRGMIPKDKEGGVLNLEPWGKIHVSPLFCSPSHVSSNHHLSYSVVSWGSCWLAGKPLLHPRLLSLHDMPFGLRMVCPLSWSWVCSFFVVLSGVKRRPQFIDWGWFIRSPLPHGLLACGLVLPSLTKLLVCDGVHPHVHAESLCLFHHCQTM